MYKRATTPSSVHKKHNTRRYEHPSSGVSGSIGVWRSGFPYLRGIGILGSSPFGDSAKFATPGNDLATANIRQMSDVPLVTRVLECSR